MEDCCAVCAENLEWVAYGFCGHREVCSTCVVRLRFIFRDRRCCICKTECPFVFVTKEFGDYTKTITDFSTFPSDPKEGRVGGSFWYHEETKVFFDDFNQYTRVKSMCRLSCTSCDKTKKGSNHRLRFKSVEHLKNHLSHQHNLHMCSLCLVGRKVFICEQKLFTKEQLNQHISSGDSEVDGSESERGGFTGHPMCEFCKRPFYGGNELYTHMSREHYTCHICQRLRPGQYEYYGNYDDLEAHFRSDHFLCEDESCLAKKFIVFQVEAELKRHNTVDHGGGMSRTQQSASLQSQVGFQVQSRRGRRRSSQASYAIDDGYPLLQPMSSSGGSRPRESSFPPLSLPTNRGVQTRFGQNSESSNTMTTHPRYQTNRSAAAGSSRAWPGLSRGPTQASVPSSIQSSSASAQSQSRTLASAQASVGGCSSGSSLNSSNAKRNHHTSSNAKLSDTRSLEQPSHSGYPPVTAVKSLRSSSSAANAKVPNTGGSDLQSDDKSLVDKIRASLGHDEELFTAFKDASGNYRHGSIDARSYLEYVKGYGLSHLVLDMARLCPDPRRQKELIDTHNACLGRGSDAVEDRCTVQQSSSESEGLKKKNKGKAVKPESSSDSSMGLKLQFSDSKSQDEEDKKGKTAVASSSGGGGKQFKKTPKFLRARLGEKSTANHRDSSNITEGEAESKNDENSKSSQSSSGGLQLRGAWRRGSAKLFS